jgi:hypothetical protein
MPEKITLPETPEERRQQLDEMSAHHTTLDKSETRYFNKLAEQVAVDEDTPPEPEEGKAA